MNAKASVESAKRYSALSKSFRISTKPSQVPCLTVVEACEDMLQQISEGSQDNIGWK